MRSFEYVKPVDPAAAIAAKGRAASSSYLGGGTNLIDLMRESIEQPNLLLDVSGLSITISETADGGLRIGAGVKNTAVAADMAVRTRFPMLAQAILSGASGQIRNMASVGGNILQRTRCYYFYDGGARCNKRVAGAGCDAIDGFNRIHAIFGGSEHCVATHPSDMCVALSALDAMVNLEGPEGARSVSINELHLLPDATPAIETALRPAELIVSIDLPPGTFDQSRYRKVRDRASYAFALVSVAAAINLSDDGSIQDVRVALGGVAPKPWRAYAAEAALRGTAPTDAAFRRAADAELAGARSLAHNGFKIDLARRVIVATLAELAGLAGARA